MGSARIYLGQWADSTGPNMHPNTEVIGGSGSVDDGSDATWVGLRAEQINAFLGAERSSFSWPDPNTDPALPEFAKVRSPLLAVTVRHELTEWPAAYEGVLPGETYRLQLAGPSFSTIGLLFLATETRENAHSNGGFGAGPYVISEGMWNDFRDNTTNYSASIERTDFLDPETFDDLPNGSKSQVNVYEILLEISWSSFAVPIRRQYPVPGTRVYPRPPFQPSGRSGPAAIL